MASYGLLDWSYTSRMVLITVSGSSNWMYSELVLRFALQVADTVVSRSEHTDGARAE
jgi:hypothetical protein